jgi:hypothetical protein
MNDSARRALMQYFALALLRMPESDDAEVRDVRLALSAEIRHVYLLLANLKRLADAPKNRSIELDMIEDNATRKRFSPTVRAANCGRSSVFKPGQPHLVGSRAVSQRVALNEAAILDHWSDLTDSMR